MKRLIIGIMLVALIGGIAVSQEPAADYLGSFTWRDDAVGGLSGLEVSADGTDFVVISDRGTRYDGTFQRDREEITGLNIASVSPIRKLNGQPVSGAATDAEGLACASPGIGAACDISFEVIHRVAYFSGPDAAAKNRPGQNTLRNLQRNSGLEALAIDPAGRLLAIPERSGELDRPFPVYRLEGRRWTTPFALRRDPPYLMVGADFGPDGKLYVLERHFALIAFTSRVRRFTIDGDRITNEETILKSTLGRHDNLEGISVWRDDTGATRLTMVSDNNFNGFQRTEFVDYRLRD